MDRNQSLRFRGCAFHSDDERWKMSFYICYVCKNAHDTNNMVPVCIDCNSREHENFLSAHRDNMHLVSRNAVLVKTIKELKARLNTKNVARGVARKSLCSGKN